MSVIPGSQQTQRTGRERAIDDAVRTRAAMRTEPHPDAVEGAVAAAAAGRTVSDAEMFVDDIVGQVVDAYHQRRNVPFRG